MIDTPEDVDGVLDLCQVLIQEQAESLPGVNGMYGTQRPRAGVQSLDLEQLAEEQGWVARMVHLFRSEDLETQFEVCRRNRWSKSLLSPFPAYAHGTETL